MIKSSTSRSDLGRLLFFTAVLFCYIFNFTLSAISISASIFVLIGCVGVSLSSSVLRRHIFESFIKNSAFLALLVFMGLYGALLSALIGDGEVTFAGIFIKNVVVFYIACVLGFIFREEAARRGISDVGGGLSFVLDLCFYAIFLQAVFVICTFVNGEFKELLANLVVNRGNIEVDHAFRFRGLHDSGGSTLGVILGMGAVYGMYSFIVKKSRWAWLRIVMSAIIICSTTLVARSGILVALIGLLLLVIRFPNRRHLKAYFLILICSFVIIALVKLIFPEQYDFFNDVIFNYAFEAFVNYQSGAGVRTESSDDLKTMLFLPDAIHVIFGSGSFDVPSNGVERSDSGYMKTMLSSGIVGFFVIYSVYAAMAFRIGRYLSRSGNQMFSFAAILGIIFVIIEIKAPVLYQNDTSRLFWLIYGVVLAYQGLYGSQIGLRHDEGKVVVSSKVPT